MKSVWIIPTVLKVSLPLSLVLLPVFLHGLGTSQIYKAYKLKSLEEFSYKALEITLLGHSLMVTYGSIIFQIPIMVNAPIAVCPLLLLLFKNLFIDIGKPN